MQKILLLGKNGMLGKALSKELSGSFDLKSFAKNELDITDFAAVDKICDELKPDFVVNATAYTAVDHAETEQDLALKINSEAVGNLAKICEKLGAKLIHFSTDYVFDGENENGFLEDDEPNPVNFYGESKLAGERRILESGCDFAIVRTSWLFGNGENFVVKMLELSRKNAEIKVVSDQIGSPTFAKDLAQTTQEILDSNANGIFHATNSGATSWANFARKIFEIKNLPIKIIDIPSAEFPTPAQRPKISILRNSKLPEMRSWEEGLEEHLGWNNFTKKAGSLATTRFLNLFLGLTHLLQRNRATRLFQIFLHFLSLLFRHIFFDNFWCRFDRRLGFAETLAGNRFYRFNRANFVVTRRS